MMRLLKYDWKRNSNVILGLMAVLLITQILIMSVGSMNDWEWGLMLVLSMLVYGAVSAILMVIVCRTFDQNIKLYNRRLLAVRTIWTIVSSLIQAWISTLVILTLVILHLWIFWRMLEIGPVLDLTKITVSDYILSAFVSIWQYTFIMLIIFFSITAARVIRKQWGLWFGILIFFFILYVIQWVEHKVLAVADYKWVGATFSLRIEEGGTTAPFNHEALSVPVGPIIFEVLLAGLLIYVMVKLIDRKVEV